MPLNQPYGTDCPNGSYCPKGTPAPVQCPKGTYQPSRGKVRVEDCVACDPGKFCDATGLSAVSGNCQQGFFCSGNASKSNPQDQVTGDICPKGSFCIEGSIKPQTCFNGTYMNHTGMVVFNGKDCTFYLLIWGNRGRVWRKEEVVYGRQEKRGHKPGFPRWHTVD